MQCLSGVQTTRLPHLTPVKLDSQTPPLLLCRMPLHVSTVLAGRQIQVMPILLQPRFLPLAASIAAYAPSASTCSLQEEWSLTAEKSWISGFIDRSQPRVSLQLPWTASQTSVPDQPPLHSKPTSFARRSLQQAAQTYQATAAFTLLFPSLPTSSQALVAQDTSDALQQGTAPLNTVITITPVAPASALTLSVSILFPPSNTVSATPSQATLAAVTLTSALTTDPAQALASLYAKHGAFQVQGTSISNALVPQGSPSSTLRASPLTASTVPSVPATPSSLSAPPPISPAIQRALPSSPSIPFQTPTPSVLPPPASPVSLAGLPSQVSMCMCA